jgi:hypothetical protein
MNIIMRQLKALAKTVLEMKKRLVGKVTGSKKREVIVTMAL